MMLIKDGKKLESKLLVVARSAKVLDANLDLVAKSAIFMFQHHGNTVYLNRLMEVMPKSVRGKAMVKYIETFAPVKFDEEKRKFFKVVMTGKKKNKKDIGKAFDNGNKLYDAMMGAFWSEYKKESTKEEKTQAEKDKVKVSNFKKWLNELPADQKSAYLAELMG